MDPVAGHIPGAVNAPTAENITGDGRFLDTTHLRERFAGLGVGDKVAVYCGSGVTAAHEIAALAIACPYALFTGAVALASSTGAVLSTTSELVNVPAVAPVLPDASIWRTWIAPAASVV